MVGFWKFTCLMNTGMPLDDITREDLFQLAKQMARENNGYITIDQDGYQGYIETYFQSVSLGAVSGIKFLSTVDTEYGTRKTVFIIPESELGFDDRGQDFQWVSLGNSQVKAQDTWRN